MASNLVWEVHVYREEDSKEERKCEDEKERNYTGPENWPHLAELTVCDGENLSITPDLILGYLGSWFS